MDLTIVGRSPAVQNPNSACSSYLISEGDTHILVDCGHGSLGVLRSILEITHLSGIVISHMHPDHIFDLVPLTYGFKFGRLPAIPLLLPNNSYSVLEGIQRAVDLSETFFADSFEIRSYTPGSTEEIGGIRIETAATRHYIETSALRFVSPTNGRAIAYSADTGWSEPVIELLRDAPVAVIEASIPAYHSDNERYGHLTPELAGRMARQAGVERLIITHYADFNAGPTRQEAEKTFGAPVELAVERAIFTV